MLEHTRLVSINGTAMVESMASAIQAARKDRVASFTVKHGHHMKQLDVRVLHHADRNGPYWDASVRWLMETTRPTRSGLSLIGMEVKGGPRSPVHVLQLSTETRCIVCQVEASGELSTLLRSLLEDPRVHKAGAQIWTCAVDLWSLFGIQAKACMDVNAPRSLQDRKLSLEALCKQTFGSTSFYQDTEATLGDWSVAELTLRQLVSAAVDGQASCYAGWAGVDMQLRSNTTTTFDLGGCKPDLLQSLAEWQGDMREEDRAQEQRREITVDRGEVRETSESGCFFVQMTRYQTRIRMQSRVRVHLKDGQSVDAMVVRVDGQSATIRCGEIGTRVTANQVDRITLSRSDEKNTTVSLNTSYVLGQLAKQSLHAPLLRALFGMPRAAGTALPELRQGVDAISVVEDRQWLDRFATEGSEMPSTTSFMQGGLNASQLRAIELAESCHVTIVQGPCGTGKTLMLAALGARLMRSDQRIWCVAATNMAARNIACALQRHVDPSRLVLGVSSEYYREWHESSYTTLLRQDCICTNAQKLPDRQVVVTTLGFALASLSANGRIGLKRTSLVVDEASQLAALQGVMLLEALHGISRLTLIGDEAQLPPHNAQGSRREVGSVLQLFSQQACEQIEKQGMRTGRCMLQVQYRMAPQIGSMISQVFYNSFVQNCDAVPTKALTQPLMWIDVRGAAERDGTSLHNKEEVIAVERACAHLIARHAPQDIVVLSFYDAQTNALKRRLTSLGVRTCNVDSFQGQEAPVVIISLTASRGVSSFLADPRRVNVACSRAQQRLWIVGNRKLFQAAPTVWSQVQTYIP